MRKHLGLVFVVVLVAAVGGASFPAASHTAADTPSQGVANDFGAGRRTDHFLKLFKVSQVLTGKIQLYTILIA